MDRETSNDVINGETKEPHLSNSQIIFEHMQELTKKTELLTSEQTTYNQDIENLKRTSVENDSV